MMALKAKVALGATLFAVCMQTALAAEDAPGVPAGVLQRPSAAQAARVSLDEPGGAPRYAPRLPRGTPTDLADADASGPVADFAAALQRTYWTQPNLLAERARLRGTDYRLPQARAQAGPRLTYEAAYGYQRDNFEQATGGWTSRSGWSSTATAILTQPLFTFGRNASAEKNALAQIAFQRATLRSTEASTLFGAIRAYVGLLRDRAGLGIFRDDLALLEREYADNKARFDKREVTSSDVQQVETRLEQARAQVFTAQSALATSEAQFLSAIGGPAASTLAPPNPLSLPVNSLEEAYAYAETHSPVLAAAYSRERISRAAADSARAGMLPRVDLRGKAEVGAITPYSDSLRQTDLRGEVVVSGPLFQSGLLHAQAKEAEAANDADWRLIDQAMRDNRAEIADAWNQWLGQSAAVAQLELSTAAARKAFDGALLQEKAGFRTTLDVLNLARELLVARSGYNSATTNAYLAQARLLALLGALEQASLFPDAAAYDPDEHYDRVKRNGEIPVIIPALRAVDSILTGGGRDRALRDPAAALATTGVALPVPAAIGPQEPEGK